MKDEDPNVPAFLGMRSRCCGDARRQNRKRDLRLLSREATEECEDVVGLLTRGSFGEILRARVLSHERRLTAPTPLDTLRW